MSWKSENIQSGQIFFWPDFCFYCKVICGSLMNRVHNQSIAD